MSRKTRFIVILSVVVLLLIIIIFVLRMLKNQETQNIDKVGREQTTENTTGLTPISVPETMEETPAEPPEENPLVIAVIFTERYGSFSSQGEFQNLKDMFSQMTPEMKQKTEKLIETTTLDRSVYSGITTKAAESLMKERTTTTATVEITTQRIQSTEENPRARVYIQKAEVKLKKDGLKWLIDDFSWINS